MVDVPSPLGSAPGGDLALARQALSGSREALVQLDSLLLRTASVLSPMGLDASAQDEVRQRLREKLLVGRALERFTGRGSLQAFLKAAAAREAIDWLREQAARHKGPTEDGDAELDLLADRTADPERQVVQAEHRALFKQAFTAAVAGLSPRERTLLRHHLLDGLTVDALAPLYRVHRATAARWVAAVREKVLEATQAELAARSGLSGEALHGLLTAIRSRLDLSLSRVLRASQP
ncbi:MAG: sigma-70 family RNA polymerase sigma factor [Myxococcales bacterium]